MITILLCSNSGPRVIWSYSNSYCQQKQEKKKTSYRSPHPWYWPPRNSKVPPPHHRDSRW